MANSSTSSLSTAASFVGSIAVNTHVGYAWTGYNNLSLVKQSLSYLGVTTVRDALTSIPEAQPVLTGLAALGYKFDFIVSSGTPSGGTKALYDFVESLKVFETTSPGSIIAVEGLNEANLQHFSYNGSSSMTAAAQFQSAFYTAVKGNAALKDIPVYNLTLGHNSAIDYAALGDLGEFSDYASAHAYVSTNTTVTSALDTSLGLATASSKGDPKVITETGYTTLASAADVGANESAQAKSILNTLVTAFQDGVAKTYLYELLDRGNDPVNVDKEAHFGLFNADGTPKLAATALHNLTTILNDDGAGAGMPTATLGYSLSNLPATGSSMVLAKSNGAYDLVVWNAPKVWNDATDQEIANPSHSVDVHFDSVQATVVVYDPMGGLAPIATYKNVQNIVLPISDHPLIVEVGGTGLIAKPSVVMPANVVGTADFLVSQIDQLKQSPGLEKITLTDSHVLNVASVSTMQYMIASDQSVLSKIVGGYQFAITQEAPTWRKTEVYSSDGKLFSVKDAGLKNGLPFTEQTKFTDGRVVTANYADGVKVNEITNRTDGGKDVYTYNIKGQTYATEHYSFAKSGAMERFERMHADGTLDFTEVPGASSKTAAWYDAAGVIIKQAEYLNNGDVATSVYTAGVKSRMYVSHADKTQEAYAYGIQNQSYVTELQKSDKAGVVVEVVRNHADGSLDYHWVKNLDGSTVTSNYDGAGVKAAMFTQNADGYTISDKYDSAGRLSQEVIQKPGDYHSITNYNGAVKASTYITNTDGSKETYIYDAGGALTTKAFIATAGQTTTSVYADGVVTRVFVANPDGTSQNTSYGIKNQSFVTELQKVDKTGAVIEVVRSHADSTLDYQWLKRSDGSTVTSNFDAAGRKTLVVTASADSVVNDRYNTAGQLTQETISKSNGYVSIINFNGTLKTSNYVTNADQSRESYLFDANGNLATKEITSVTGLVTTSLYADGALSRVFMSNPDGTRENTSYGINNQSYVTEVQKVDKAGGVTEVVRSHADGTLDYHWVKKSDGGTVTSNFDAAGHKLNVVSAAAGAFFTELFDPSTGAYAKTVAQAANGDVVTVVYTNAVKSAVYGVYANGSKTADLFDSAGTLTSSVRQAADGHTETSLFANGVLDRLFVKNADGSGENTSYGIKNQTYVTETQTVDKAGKVVDVERLHADGSLDYHWSLTSSGTETTSVYDARGTKASDVIQNANGSTDVFKFVMAGQPGVSQHEAYNASKTLIMLDVTNADGSHQVVSKTGGATLSGGNGNDVVTMFGKDTFVFDHGRDTISNFHADDAAANHDQLQISKSLAASFAALHLDQVGADTLITINAYDSILLKGVAVAHVTAGDFVFA